MRAPGLGLGLGLGLAALAACGDPVDPPPLGDYTAWDSFVFSGPAPGHGDTYRVVYVNPLARCGLDACPPGTPVADPYITYPEGATLVKEVYDHEGGALHELVIMRRLVGSGVPAALTEEGGWLFSATDAPGGDEVHHDLCWARCHSSAPYNGVFYDYRQPL